jgi:serine/threonine-protein kinase
VVPDLVGLPEADVAATLEAAGLVPGERRNAFHPTAPVGRVIDQSPDAGAELLPGGTVGYTLSAGPRPASS